MTFNSISISSNDQSRPQKYKVKLIHFLCDDLFSSVKLQDVSMNTF